MSCCRSVEKDLGQRVELEMCQKECSVCVFENYMCLLTCTNLQYMSDTSGSMLSVARDVDHEDYNCYPCCLTYSKEVFVPPPPTQKQERVAAVEEEANSRGGGRIQRSPFHIQMRMAFSFDFARPKAAFVESRSWKGILRHVRWKCK